MLNKINYIIYQLK